MSRNGSLDQLNKFGCSSYLTTHLQALRASIQELKTSFVRLKENERARNDFAEKRAPILYGQEACAQLVETRQTVQLNLKLFLNRISLRFTLPQQTCGFGRGLGEYVDLGNRRGRQPHRRFVLASFFRIGCKEFDGSRCSPSNQESKETAQRQGKNAESRDEPHGPVKRRFDRGDRDRQRHGPTGCGCVCKQDVRRHILNCGAIPASGSRLI